MKGGRSPAYPYIDLKKAIDKVESMHDYAKRHAVGIGDLYLHWGFSGSTGSSKKTLAALKYYGLVDQEHGSKEAKLSDRALHIIHGLEDSKEKKEAVRNAFLTPPIYKYCWETWGADSASMSGKAMASHLILKKSFNDSTVNSLVSNYKQSLTYSGLATMEHTDFEEDGIEQPEAGDFIQREPQGLVNFPPMKVRDVNVSEGVLFVEGSDEEIPISEITIVEAPESAESEVKPPLGAQAHGVSTPPPGVNMRQETFTLSDSQILIQFPASMSSGDYEDFTSWLEILHRKIGRGVESKNKPKLSVSYKEDEGG